MKITINNKEFDTEDMTKVQRQAVTNLQMLSQAISNIEQRVLLDNLAIGGLKAQHGTISDLLVAQVNPPVADVPKEEEFKTKRKPRVKKDTV